MTKRIAALTIAALLTAGGAAFAGPDDAKWVARCIQDNKDEKVAIDVITKYCTCMNNKMDDNETKTITEWEKTHATERKQCDAESGWK